MTDREMKALGELLTAHKERILRPVAKYLAVLYSGGQATKIANLCDEELDPSGNLLGWVREEATALKNAQ